MTRLTRFKFFLWSFGLFKVPMIGYLRPKLLRIDEQQIIVKIPLRRRSKNHLNSMYFGALAIGADIAGGFHGFYHAALADVRVSLVFKSFQARFLKRPESDVYFICDAGEAVKHMIVQSKETKERVNAPILIKAFVHYPSEPEEIAHFTLELSIKVEH